MKRICVIGNFSGRNAGDAAILGGLLEDVTTHFPDVVYDVPTIKPKFVASTYRDYPVRPVGLLPWNLSIKIFGLPILRSVLRSDLILLTDAILFDLHLFNPLFNYLSTMALLLPLAERARIPIVLYNVSLGPVSSSLGAWCLRRVLDVSSAIIVRDEESLELMDRLGFPRDRAQMGADCALNVRPSPPDTARAMLKEGGVPEDGPLMTINVNSYLNVFVRGHSRTIGVSEFSSCIARTVDRLVDDLGLRMAFVVTQPMDLKLTNEVMARIRRRDRVGMVSNVHHSYRDLAAVFAAAELHLGMRTHSLILPTAVGTPVVGIIATPKNRGFMRSIEQDDQMIEFPDLTTDHLVSVVEKAWQSRLMLKERLAPIAAREKEKARRSAERLIPFLADHR